MHILTSINWFYWLTVIILIDIILIIIWSKYFYQLKAKPLISRIWSIISMIMVTLTIGVTFGSYCKLLQKSWHNSKQITHAQYEKVAKPVTNLQHQQNQLLNQMQKSKNDTSKYREFQIQYYRTTNQLVIARDKLQKYNQKHQ